MKSILLVLETVAIGFLIALVCAVEFLGKIFPAIQYSLDAAHAICEYPDYEYILYTYKTRKGRVYLYPCGDSPRETLKRLIKDPMSCVQYSWISGYYIPGKVFAGSDMNWISRNSRSFSNYRERRVIFYNTDNHTVNFR